MVEYNHLHGKLRDSVTYGAEIALAYTKQASLANRAGRIQASAVEGPLVTRGYAYY